MGEIFGSDAHVCQPLWRAAVLLSVPPSPLKANSKEAAAALNPAAVVVTLTYEAGFVKAQSGGVWLKERARRLEPPGVQQSAINTLNPV